MEELRKTTNRFNQNSECSGMDSNRDPLELVSTPFPICQSGVKPCSFTVKYLLVRISGGAKASRPRRARRCNGPSKNPGSSLRRGSNSCCVDGISASTPTWEPFLMASTPSLTPPKGLLSEQPSYSKPHARRQ
jgi:hypothetical protein